MNKNISSRGSNYFLTIVPLLLQVKDPDLQLGGQGGGGGGAFEDLTLNVEFCKDNSSSLLKMRYFRKNMGGGLLPWIHHCMVISSLTYFFFFIRCMV